MNNFILTSFRLKTKVRVNSRVNHFELTNPKTVHAHVFCFLIQSVLFSQEKKGLSRLHNWKFPQSYTTSREGISRPDKCRGQSRCPQWQMPAKSWTGKYFPDARTHIVVHFLNSAFAILSRSDLQFLRPHWILQFLGQDMAYFRVTACRTRRTRFWAQMLCNLCNLHLSAAHLLLHLPQVPVKAARTVRPKGIFSKLRAFLIWILWLKFYSENRCQV